MEIKYLISGLFLFFLLSCRSVSETEKEMKQFLGSKVDLPDELVQRLSAKNDYYLIIYLETEDCIPCSLNNITLLDHYKDDFEKFNTGIALIIKENDDKEQIRDMFVEMKIKYPLFFDKDDYLLKNNPIISTNPLCHTFIIDRDMKVIWIGSPIANAKSIERYRELMFHIIKLNPGKPSSPALQTPAGRLPP
jgi:hypothetical protein